MKISEMTTTSFADFVTVASDSISNVMQNDAVIALFSNADNKTPMSWFASILKVLCGPCREDVFVILGALCNKSADEIKKQNILVTIGMLREIYNDAKDAEIPE